MTAIVLRGGRRILVEEFAATFSRVMVRVDAIVAEAERLDLSAVEAATA